MDGELERSQVAQGQLAKWHRGSRGRGVKVTSMLEDLECLTDVVRERRVLETARFGDPD